jgi:tetratricopeptide (TPR) repeat protein
MFFNRYCLLRCLIALAIGVSAATLSWFTENNFEIPPELWHDISVASSLRPPMHEFPLLWQNILSQFISHLGLASCVSALKIAGAISLGLMSVLAFKFFSNFIDKKEKNDFISLVIISLSTILFIFSEPVWLSSRILSPAMFLLFLTMLVLVLTQKAVIGCSYFSLVSAGIFSGILAAETPLGVLSLIFCIVSVRLKDWDSCVIGDKPPSLSNPIVAMVAIRWTCLGFIISWAATIAVNLTFYRINGGGGESDVVIFISLVRYFVNYFGVACRALSPFGAFVMLVSIIAPLVILLARRKKLCDLSLMLPVRYAFFTAIVGVIAFAQSTGFRECHFWRWMDDAFSSEYLVSLGLLSSSLTVFLALRVFATDIFYRNHTQILSETYVDAMLEESVILQRIISSYKITTKVLRPIACLLPIVALVLVLPYKFDKTRNEITAIVADIARESVDECADAEMIFTDGSYDAGIELFAAMEGKKLKALSLMSKNGKYDTALRLRGETSEERMSLLKIGTAEALRTWVKENNLIVSNIALQVGMELWRKNIDAMPKAGGLVMRTAGFAVGKSEKAANRAKAMAEQILELYEKCDVSRIGYRELNQLFVFGQWRLSRMCRMRANEAERNGKFDVAEIENELADRLDQANPEWRRVQERMDWVTKQQRVRLTPQEGLKIGLERADFKLASVYARQILTYDADDLKANFAVGMGLFIDEEYGRAEKYLRKCLVKAPNEPAVLNNLAIALLRLGRYAEAETNAVKALEIMPNSSEIRTTLRHIRKAKTRQKSP